MESHDAMYAQALAHRDGKMEGFTESESLALAENIFLQLAEKGHQKAAHNYGSMMHRAGKYDLAYQYFQTAGLPASIRNCQTLIEKGLMSENRLFLIVGSTRSVDNSLVMLINKFQKVDGVDLTHTKSFGGKATTMDLEPVDKRLQQEGTQHIVGDSKTFDFSGLDIAHVLLERPPVFTKHPGLVDEKLEYVKENIIAQMVENISKGMKSGSILEIEWDPYTGLSNYPLEELEESIRRNPFAAQFHIDHIYGGLAALNKQLTVADFPPDMTVDIANDMAAKMHEHLSFFVSQGMADSYTDILDVCGRENFWTQKLLMSRGAKNLFIQSDMMTDSAQERIKALSTAVLVDARVLSSFNLPGYPRPCAIRLEGEMRRGTVLSQSEFMTFSYLNFLLSHIAVQTNQHLVKEYLESVGFTHVTIERRTNVHNGRRNVWMVRAVMV